MKRISTKSILPLAMAAGLLGTATWSTTSQACSIDPVMASVCIMATYNYGSFNNQYVPANGATLPINQYTALYALIGTTYGGNATTNFVLPDLSGRVVVGAGTSAAPTPGIPVYSPGNKGGAVSVVLSSTQMPAHVHTLVGNGATAAVSWAIGTLAANTTMTGLSGTTSLNGIAQTGLTLNASTGGTLANSPSSATLGTTVTGGPLKIYSDAAPTVAMKTGSIGGTLTGSASTTITGSPTTTLSGAPAVTLSGTTGVAGANIPVPTMPPYLALSYFIATNGYFPTRD